LGRRGGQHAKGRKVATRLSYLAKQTRMENQNEPAQPRNWWNKYSQERKCARCPRTFIAKSPNSLYCQNCREAKTKENRATYLLRKKLHLTEKRKTKQRLPSADVCWWCLGVCKPGENCPDCGTPYDLEKATKAQSRQNVSYLDIVAQNAKKEGKNPKAELERIRSLRMTGTYGNKQYWKDVNNILDNYLSKKGYRVMYNGVVVEKKPKNVKN